MFSRILTSVLSLFLLTSSGFGDVVARLIKVEGDVNYKRFGSQTFDEKATLGSAIFNGDEIQVGEVGFAAVMYVDDKTILKIRENSKSGFMDTQNTRTVDIKYGTILNNVKTEGRTKGFRVQTPISVASVKGTQFAAIVSQNGIDSFIGKEGLFEVLNMVSGETVSVGPGQKAVSNAMGSLVQAPASPEEYPEDPEIEEPQQPEEEIEETEEIEPEEVEETPEQPERQSEPERQETEPDSEQDVEERPETVDPIETPDVPEEPSPSAPPKPFGMGMGIGSVTIDGILYNQLALRPEINIGKIGFGLDLVLYLDFEGNIRTEDWDIAENPAVLFDKILYIKFAEKSDPLWFKYGNIENMTLGYGGLMNNYSNMMEFPSVRRTGLNTGFNFGPVGGELFFANLKDFSRGGTLIGLRTSYTVSENFPLTFGLNIVSDVNMFSGLKDADDDSYPDIFDDFPNDKKYAVDTDEDGLADNDTLEYDIDGDGLTDILYPHQYDGDDTLYVDTEIIRKATPFSLENNKAAALGFSFDIGYPVFQSKPFSLELYSEFNSLNFPNAVTEDSTFNRIERSGTGITAPGLRSTIFNLLNFTVEYRIVNGSYVPSFFDQSYDLTRVVANTVDGATNVQTKDMYTFDENSNEFVSQGLFGAASMNLFNLASFSASYANMVSDTVEYNSFFAFVDLNADNIPKVSSAMAYYQRNNDLNPFDFENPTENTILGYKIGYELSDGVSLIWDFRQYYRDNGTGTLEPIKQTTIETSFNF